MRTITRVPEQWAESRQGAGWFPCCQEVGLEGLCRLGFGEGRVKSSHGPQSQRFLLLPCAVGSVLLITCHQGLHGWLLPAVCPEVPGDKQ